MFFLPAPSQELILTDPIPGQLIKLPPVPLLQILVTFTRDYRSIVSDLTHPTGWQSFRSFVAERTDALKITDLSNKLYENDAYPCNAMFQLSLVADFRRFATELACELGYPGLESQRIEEADPEGVRQFTGFLMDVLWQCCKAFDEVPDDEAAIERQNRYWKEVHPKRRLEVRQRIERDMQIWMSILFNYFFNAVGVMAYGESVSSMVQRVLAGGTNADESMCRAVRVDNRLRQHPVFMSRYLRATQDGDTAFLRKFNDLNTPFTDKIRFPGLYFMLALADGFGLLPQLSNAQLLDLADHAELHLHENRIEDAGYMGKRRNEYNKRKFQLMSMH